MKLYEVKKLSLKVLKEYASNDAIFTSISGKKGTKGSGKKADNIALGTTRAYQDNTYLTKYEKQLPHLSKLTQQLKTGETEGALEVLGPALEELLVLIKAAKPLTSYKGLGWKLPLGDNIYLTQSGKQYFIKYNGPKEKDPNKNDLTSTKHHDKAILSSPA